MYSKPLRYAPLSFVILDDMQFWIPSEFDINICDEKQKVENVAMCVTFSSTVELVLLHCELFTDLDVQ